jgi:outer membrane protein assembly factor BamB
MKRGIGFTEMILFILPFVTVTGICLAGGIFPSPWPQWQGPKRNNISGDTYLLKEWPTNGPALLWTASGCGKGYSSLAVTYRMIYTAGTSNDQTYVVAFDLDGKLKWRVPNGKPWSAGPNMNWARSYDGARATPTVNDGLVYHLNEMGHLSAFDATDGKVVWSLNFLSEFGAKVPDYGYSESVLIDGDKLICYPGGTKGYMVALNRKNGSVIWANTNINLAAAFSSAILAEDQGIREVITLTETHVIGVNADTGELLWKHPFTNKRQNNIPTPIYDNGSVYASTGYGSGSIRLKLVVDGKKVTVSQVWANAELDNVHGGVVLMDGFLYGASHEKPAWLCLNAETGQRQWRDAGVGSGSVVYADGMLYCVGEHGTVALVVCTSKGYEVKGSFELPKGDEGMSWAHPVVCNGRLYIRHADHLYAYNIREK